MWDFSLGRAIGLKGKTLPFIGLRLAVYFGITLAYVVMTGGGGGIGYLMGGAGGTDAAYRAAWWGAVGGFGLVTAVLYFAREYLLYLVKAGHIAVLVHLLDGGRIPGGKTQIRYAAETVRNHFAESSMLFAVDQLIKGILRAFNGAALMVMRLIPVPALQGAMKFVAAVINMSLTYVDEVILAYNIRTKQDNPWAGARDGVVLYAQNYRNLLKNALWLTAFVWLLTTLVFIAVLAPVSAMVTWMPSAASFWAFAIAAVTAWSIKSALIDPIAMTCLMQAYFKAIEGQQPRRDWADKLNRLSVMFRDLRKRAVSFGSSGSRKPGSVRSALS